MKILVVNDDGIGSEGIRKLAEIATEFGETWIVAPDHPCSAVSQKITIGQDIILKKYDFPISGIAQAFACSGTPADCVDAAVRGVMDAQPDVIFSGINNGFNAGYDIAYSGTVGAAMEGLMLGIPAVAFSHEASCGFEVTDRFIREIIEKILAGAPLRDRIWNVNFPERDPARCREIRWGVKPAPSGFYRTAFQKKTEEKHRPGEIRLVNADLPEDRDKFPEGADLAALADGAVAVGTIRCEVL